MTFGLALVVRGPGGFHFGSPYFSARAAATLSRGVGYPKRLPVPRGEATRGRCRLFGTALPIRKVCLSRRSRDIRSTSRCFAEGKHFEWAFKASQKQAGPWSGPVGVPVGQS